LQPPCVGYPLPCPPVKLRGIHCRAPSVAICIGTWLIHSRVCHDLITYVPWLIRILPGTLGKQFAVRHDSLIHVCAMTHSFMCVPWLTHSCVCHDSISYVPWIMCTASGTLGEALHCNSIWLESIVCIQLCAMSQLHMCHASFMYCRAPLQTFYGETWLTNSCVCHASISWVLWTRVYVVGHSWLLCA